MISKNWQNKSFKNMETSHNFPPPRLAGKGMGGETGTTAMNGGYEFRPPLRMGALFQFGAITVLAIMAGWGLWRASQAEIGLSFVLYLLPTLLAVVIGPLLVYRYLALRGASYRLERDGISLRWGLRAEDIPIDTVSWVRTASELGRSLPLPWLRWPGAMLGVRRLPNGTTIEYMAADLQRLVLVATTQCVYALSPEDPSAFLAAYQRLTEMGSLTPLAARSVHPTFLLARIWRTASARYLLLGGLALNLFLLVWVTAVAPGRAQVILGFQRGGETMPGIRLLLLPVLSSFSFLVDFFVGLFFYRRDVVHQADIPPERAPYLVLAYLLWGSGVLTPLLFIAAVVWILLS